MTGADFSLLRRLCPPVIYALLTLRMLLKRMDDVERIEDLLLDTGATSLRDPRALERAKAKEIEARKACHEMLRRIGPLPEIDQNFELELLTPTKSRRSNPKSSR